MDASKFSLDVAAEFVKPYIPQLPFRKLKDYVEDVGHKEVIDGVQCRLDLWGASSSIPVDVDQTWKAHGLVISNNVSKSSDRKKIIRIDRSVLILMCPTDDILWALQTVRFVPQKVAGGYFEGQSSLQRIREEDYKTFLYVHPDLSAKFYHYVMRWAGETVAARNKITESLDALVDKCSNEIVRASDPSRKIPII